MFFAEFMLFSSINSRFNSIFFIEVGLSTAEIGIILAIYSIFAIFAGPFWTLLADKMNNAALILAVCSTGATISFLSYSLATQFFHFLIVRSAFSMFFPPISSLMDAIGFNTFESNSISLAAKQAAYGKERLWGAVSWAITHILIGFLMDAFHVASTVLYTFSIVSLLFFVAIVLWTRTLRHGQTKLSTVEEDGFELHTAAVADTVLFESQVSDADTAAVSINTDEDMGSENRCDEQVLIGGTTSQARGWVAIKNILCKDARSIVFFLDVTVLGMGTSLVEGLVFVFFVNDLNASNSLCGISVLITVLFEIPIFYYSDHVVEYFSNRTLMGIAHVAYVVRVVGYTVIPNPWWLLMLEVSTKKKKRFPLTSTLKTNQFVASPLLKPLHGVTYACFQLSSVAIASHLAPGHLQSTAQGLRSAFLNFGAAVGYIFGGYIMQYYESNTLYRSMAGIVFVALLLYISSAFCLKPAK